MTEVFAVICANGLGHFRRTIGLLDRLSASEPALALTIAAEPWQWEQTRSWAAAARVHARARHVAGITAPGVTWRRSAADYDDGRLFAWEARLAALDGLDAARLVLSDNLVGTLAVRRDAVLLGSFLWSDVLAHAYPDHPAVSAFVAHDRALLDDVCPPMICVEPIAMRGVVARTRAVGVPWMCEHVATPRRARAPRPRVVLAGGATGAADALLDAAELRLRAALSHVEVTRGAPLSSGGELDLSATD
ncbi:hypothetical protein L6R52_21515, partial [Myxococcota bacterium]|nr:hypothetical protein [Myxococcota bacterium]